MKKGISFFLLLFWGLLLCTFLSQWIEEQMVIETEVIESEGKGTLELPATSLISDVEGNPHLYRVKEEEGWNQGIYAEEVDPYGYQVIEDTVFVQGAFGKYIRSATKQAISGEKIRIISRTEESWKEYLVVRTKGKFSDKDYLRPIKVIDEVEEGALVSWEGKSPFMEAAEKKEIGFEEEVKVYSVEEIKVFFQQLPKIAGLLSLIIFSVLFIEKWCRDSEKQKGTGRLLVNTGILVVLGLLFRSITKMITFPSSLLPNRNIFSFCFYQEEFVEIFSVLSKLESELAKQMQQECFQQVVIAIGIIGVGIVAGGALFLKRKSGCRRNHRKGVKWR